MYYVVLVIAFILSNYALGTKISKHCETETEPTKPRCGDNEVFSKCKIDCPPQSCESIYRSYSVCDPDRPCIPGCDCIDGYLRDANNTCILSESCPPAPTIPTEPQCGPNEVATNCKIVCPPQTCAGLHIKIACINDPPCESGCDCIEGYRRDENNECIPTDKCPGVPNKPCGLNETTVDCAFRCPNQYCPADDSLIEVACKPGRPCPAGCGCKDGYLRKSDDDDTCILASDCPPVECTRPNEVWDPCSSDCLVEKCGETQQSGCETSGCKPRCVCKKNHCRDKDDICVKSKHCGSGNDNGGSTTTSASSSHSESNSSSSSSSSTSSSSSSASSSGSSGSTNGHSCEPTCAVPNPPNCPPITKTKSTKHGACQDGFILSKKGGKCIKIEDCPTKPNKCGYNEKYVKCRTVCPPQSCNISYTEYSCSGPKTCEPGCDCIQDHLRNASNICIPNDQCSYMPIVSPKPICGLNEVHSKCKRVCPPQTCESLDMAYACDGPSLPPCEPGCNCIDGYYRDANNVCVAEKECKTEPTKPQCGDNEVFSKCKIDCPPQSCESIYSSYGVCDPDRPCIPGCDCIDGYLRDANNTCILSESCPPAPTIPTEPQCGPNEVATNCKIVCPPQTCAGLHIKIACIKDPPCESGCDCIEGYRRDENNACIPTDKCPGVPNKPCGLNETTVDCAFRCPNQYCPADDSLIKVACKPGRPCPAGCGCKDGYLRKSHDDDTCILASDCSPVECTRPNEVWDPCSSDCLIEKCGETQQTGCETSGCKPRCVCKKNYCRDKDDICVKSKNCGSGNGHFCEPTCAVPNPPNCPLITKTKSTKHGTCQDGFILSKKGGKCIRIEDCPKGCNGDPNAIAKACPAGCPSTCAEPNASHCYNHCEPLGCECAFGYLRSKTNGKCILPHECPGGNPCSRNETFVACKSGCPTDYCPQDDSRAIVACDPVPRPMCLSGCVCQLNHKKLSTKDPRCIVSSECPPVKCTRQNEEWNPCPSDCQGESCDSANKEPVTCNTLVLNCQPRCTCMKNFFRNSDDICISAKDCECEN